jgi:hypothetical protein
MNRIQSIIIIKIFNKMEIYKYWQLWPNKIEYLNYNINIVLYYYDIISEGW